MTKSSWTKSEVRKLELLAVRGASVKDIALELKRSQESVRAKIHRLMSAGKLDQTVGASCLQRSRKQRLQPFDRGPAVALRLYGGSQPGAIEKAVARGVALVRADTDITAAANMVSAEAAQRITPAMIELALAEAAVAA